jgi:hypothetical protein
MVFILLIDIPLEFLYEQTDKVESTPVRRRVKSTIPVDCCLKIPSLSTLTEFSPSKKTTRF